MIENEIEQLNTMNTPELKQMFLRYFRYTPIKRGKEFYISSIAYRMQELEFGGLPTITKNLLIQMHTKTAPQKKKTIAPIGTRIIKTYKGQEEERGWMNGKRYIAVDWRKAVRKWFCKENGIEFSEMETMAEICSDVLGKIKAVQNV